VYILMFVLYRISNIRKSSCFVCKSSNTPRGDTPDSNTTIITD